MKNDKILYIKPDQKNLIVFNLGYPDCSYVSDDKTCMIKAWDIEQALKIYKLNNPVKKIKRSITR